MNGDEAAFTRAMGRIRVAILGLGAAGTVVAWYFLGWPHGLGFLAGAVASLLNFHWLHALVASLGEGGRRPGKRLALIFAFRYLILGAGAYVIVKYFGVNLAAVVVGFLMAAAAVILEILYELIYART